MNQEEMENHEKLLWLKEAIAKGLASGVAEDGSFERIRQHLLDRSAAKEGSRDRSQP